MSNFAPTLPDFLIITDDAYLAAELSSVVGLKGRYTPVIDGPRIHRPDLHNETVRRSNVAALYQPKHIIFGGLEDIAKNALRKHLPDRRIKEINSLSEADAAGIGFTDWPNETLHWGKQDIGLGLLTALREGKRIVFDGEGRVRKSVGENLDHLVVCEDGDLLAQVIAANYAFSINAGLCLIPEVEETLSESICEAFYSSTQNPNFGHTECLVQLKEQILSLCGEIPSSKKRMITFISRQIPWGFAFPDVPTTHLFSYPDFGISLVRAIAAEQKEKLGTVLSILIDPLEVEVSETDAVKKALAGKGSLCKVMRGKGANVYEVSRSIGILPFDFLLISTHCGYVDGWRWTYEYTDSEGIERILVTDIGIGVARLPMEEDKLEVMQFFKFISLDGVDWADPIAKKSLYVGTALKEFMEDTDAVERMKPTKKEKIARVLGCNALKMSDHNYLPMPEQMVAGQSAPIILNNACCSWHHLAKNFIFTGARCYLGTLFDVLDSQAQEIAIKLTDKYFGKPLAVALWRAQNEVYRNNIKRPYIMVGPHFVRFAESAVDGPPHLLKLLGNTVSIYLKAQSGVDKTSQKFKKYGDFIDFLKKEIAAITNEFFI